MNKLFYFLLFLSVAGAGVLWWLMHAVEDKTAAQSQTKIEAPKGLVIEDKPSATPQVSREVLDMEVQEEEASDELDIVEANGSIAEAPKNEPTPVASDAKPSTLSISSDPEGVAVFLDGKRIGQTPLERSLTQKVQKFRFEKEGFVPVEREAPAEARPEGAYMSWRISMVPQQLPASQKSRMDEDHFLKGVSGPVFVQIRAVSSDAEPRAAVVKTIEQMRKTLREERVFACEVSLGEKGRWSRILVGPFSSKQEARRSLSFLKESLKADDLFVTGEQSCL